jgi:putative FmdB family regulatory protein
MPLFEFVCSKCNQTFEELVRSANAIEDVLCPSCGSSEINKKISMFASKSTGSSSFSLSSASSASCSPAGT